MFLYPVTMATKVTTHQQIWEYAIFLSQLSPNSKARIQGVSIRNIHSCIASQMKKKKTVMLTLRESLYIFHVCGICSLLVIMWLLFRIVLFPLHACNRLHFFIVGKN